MQRHAGNPQPVTPLLELRRPIPGAHRAEIAQMDQSGRFLNQHKHFFANFCLIGFRIFSLILLAGFYFCW
jgi:hypothetical protein